MEKDELKEIKKGKTGTGILIENDGYISMDYKENKKLMESIKLNEEMDNDFHCPYPFIVSAVFQKFGIENANGRIYPEHILKREVQAYEQKIREKRAIGELNHPSESIIDLERVAMNIVELRWEGHTLVGKLEVVTTPGFRKYGICSTEGDKTANLLLNGIKIGVSSRGLGSVEKKFNKMIVGDDYELVCWDFVSDPSTPNAWVSTDEHEIQSYLEEKDKEDKNKLFESLERYDKWLNIE